MSLYRYRLAVLPERMAVYVACTMSDFSAPRLVTHYWPTTESAADMVRYLRDDCGKAVADLPDLRKCSPGQYTLQPGGAWSPWITLTLVNGGQTQPDETVIADYPCPKVRKGIETRYKDGEWQKRLAATGWQPA